MRANRARFCVRAASDACGQVIFLMPLFLFTFFIFGVLVFDVGLLLVDRRDAQNHADRAALAGALELIMSGPSLLSMESDAEDSAREWAVRNRVDVDEEGVFDVELDYGDICEDSPLNPGGVTVTIARDVPSIFARFIGLELRSGATATACAMVEAGPFAIFATHPACVGDDSVAIEGSWIYVVGRVHGNGRSAVNGSHSSFSGGFTYGCSMVEWGVDNVYAPAPHPAPPEPPPMAYVYAHFQPHCTLEFAVDTDLAFVPAAWASPTELRPGVYCSQRSLTLNRDNISGSVTLVTRDRKLTLAGDNHDLAGHLDLGDGPVLAYSGAPASVNPALEIRGSGGTWSGLVLAPLSRVHIGAIDEANPQGLIGSIIARRVTVFGTSLAITATYDPGGDASIALVR